MTETAPTYEEILGRNIGGARGRLRLSQLAVAKRMKGLGFDWHQQTVGAIETAKRRVTAGEIIGLAQALGTTVPTLMKPTDDDRLVKLPNGAVIAAVSVWQLVSGSNDHAVQWDGNNLVIPPAAARVEGSDAYMLRGGVPPGREVGDSK